MRDSMTGALFNGSSPTPQSSLSLLSSSLTTALPDLLGSITQSPLNASMGWGNDNPDNHYATCPSTDMPWSNVLFMLLYSVVAIVGLLGNTLVIYVVLRYSNMQTVTNMYILNLAIADECFLIGIPFIIATMNLSRWPFGTIMCKAYMVSTSITQFTSSIFLLVMSTDRYIAICHHVSSPKYRTPTVSRIVAAVAWLTSALIMLPIMLYATTVEVRPNVFTCHIGWPEDGNTGPISFIFYSFTLGFAIPLLFIMTFYCLVIRKLRSLSKKTNKSQNKRRSHRKVTKLVLTVITVYVLCWLPYWTSQMALIANPESCNTRLSITIFLFVGVLGYSNSAINPILYAYLSDNFKKSFLKACICAGTQETNAQLKVENSVLPRKLRNGKRLNSDFGTTTMISSAVVPGMGTGGKQRGQRTNGCSATTASTSVSMLPSSLMPSPGVTVTQTISLNGHSLNDGHQREVAAISYDDKLASDGEDEGGEEEAVELPWTADDEETCNGRSSRDLIKM